jgi:signal transduction histidine kinase
MHKELLEVSRQAGMAEVATGVLHNVGNVLNSVNVSASLLADGIRKSRGASLERVVALLQEHQAGLAEFISVDERGRHLPAYLEQLSKQLASERQDTLRELDALRANVEHIKEVVAMQQSYAKLVGVTESVDVRKLVEESLRLNTDELERQSIRLQRDFAEVPPITVDKHRVLQILVNLLRNAKHACQATSRTDKCINVRVSRRHGGVDIAVTDNGVGIAPENLARIFTHGFTTKKDGHGFGLHSGALAARELGGALRVESPGAGRGATFVLELPTEPNGNAHGH